MFTYHQRTGKLEHPLIGLLAVGYAGYDDGDGIPEPDEGKNDPSKQAVQNVGPVPVGDYTIGEPFSTDTRPFAMRLNPKPGTNTFGRSGFLIHGDGYGKAAGTKSHGCIVVPRIVRWAIWGSGDRDLRVVAE